MILKTKNKWVAARAMLNVLLKDKTKYCNWCGVDFDPENVHTEEHIKGHWCWCCDNPQIGTHADHLRGLVKQNKEIRDSRKKDTAAFNNNAMRWGVSLPPRVFQLWEAGFIKAYNVKLLSNNTELHEFMKEFKAFCIPKKI